ncbi:MAG: hypothetical protein ICV67_02175 [Thermoleophilia bacterium]|nr:hypothetical protein [Thermoleophilia bacterium]
MSTTTADRHVAVGFKRFSLRRVLEFGGFVAGAILIAFGAAAIYMGVDGRTTVRDSLAAEKIVGTDDMSPALITEGIAEAGIAGTPGLVIPTKDVAGKPIQTGADARAFAQYLRIHALEASGGFTYAEMGRFATADGSPKGTSDPAAALKDESGNPVPNATRNTWVTATALSTALNMSYMAEQLALFGLVVGIALLLSGIGFIVLAYAALHRKRTV